jgi:murein tripeptide amidase MpaA
MKISSNFDGGNIKIISAKHVDNIELQIMPDNRADFLQWFYFRLQGVAGYPCKIRITNAGNAFSKGGWENYNVCASYDRATWFRVPTAYDGQVLTIDHKPELNSVFYAYFAPFSHEQHLNLVHTAQQYPRCILDSVGRTAEGRDIDLLILGEPAKEKKNIWILGRQHPGESMASWFIQGFLDRMLDEADPASRKILEQAVFYVIPYLNIDGGILGNIRTNANGIDLNREWETPDKERSPEVYYTLQYMLKTGVDLNLDIHGEEELPYVFTSSIQGIPGFTKRLAALQEHFITNWESISPDFQTEYGYPADKPGKANLSICSKNIAQRFDCLSLTVEMPFKDNQNLPDPKYGWSPERSGHLGASLVNAILSIVNEIRTS